MALRTKVAAYFSYLMTGEHHHWWDGPVVTVLDGLAYLYKWGVTRRYLSYCQHPERQQHLSVPVISIGNITVGGTGKTPMTCHLARYLQRHGKKVALLSRGYRSIHESAGAIVSNGESVLLNQKSGGDEACLMARSLPGIPVLIGSKRYDMGKKAIEMFQPDVILLDDGFQYWPLYRDLDIVLIDSTNPWGNGKLLPRGILREPIERLARADAIILTKVDQCPREDVEELRQDLRQYNAIAPVVDSVHSASWCISFQDWLNPQQDNTTAPVLLTEKPVVAVSALGNPESFEYTVQSYGYILDDVVRYDDHHQYTVADMQRLQQLAAETDVVLVTTEKDAIKMPATYIEANEIPLYVLGMDIEIIEGKEELQHLIQKKIGG